LLAKVGGIEAAMPVLHLFKQPGYFPCRVTARSDDANQV